MESLITPLGDAIAALLAARTHPDPNVPCITLRAVPYTLALAQFATT